MLDATCAVCDGRFVQRNKNHKHCCAQCRYLSRAKTVACAVCGGQMYVGPGSLPEGQASHRGCKPKSHGGSWGYTTGCRCDECKAWHQNYYSNPEMLAKRRSYYRDPRRRERYRSVERLREARREAALRAAPSTTFTADDLEERLSMFAGCWICGRDLSAGSHIDHVKPLSKGGSHMLSNLRPACPECNIRKGATWPFRALPTLPRRAV